MVTLRMYPNCPSINRHGKDAKRGRRTLRPPMSVQPRTSACWIPTKWCLRSARGLQWLPLTVHQAKRPAGLPKVAEAGAAPSHRGVAELRNASLVPRTAYRRNPGERKGSRPQVVERSRHGCPRDMRAPFEAGSGFGAACQCNEDELILTHLEVTTSTVIIMP